MIKRQLLQELQQACNQVTKEYQAKTGNSNIRFCVLQLLQEQFKSLNLKTDLVRQAAELYDEYEGNEEYIHIPDITQMLYNLQQYPVLGAFDIQTRELEGITTIKYHENSSNEEIDPYYPKEGVNFFTITGVIVRQRENMLHKGLGSNLYTASLLGLYNYTSKHPEKEVDLNVVIDCTNLPGLCALSSGNKNLSSKGYLGENKILPAVLDGIYTVRGENGKLVEAPTYAIRIPLNPTENNKEKTECVFSYCTGESNLKDQKYEEILNTILKKIKQDKSCIVTQMEDKGTGTVSYIHTDKLGIYLEDMKIERNGAHNIGQKRIPRKDVNDFVGPMPDFSKYIEEDNDDR